MKFVQSSSFDEYACWFFERAVRREAWVKVPATPEERIAAFRAPEACGKFHEWFLSAGWTIQTLESPHELAALMVVSAQFTRVYGLWNPPEQRLLGIEAKNALTNNYFLGDPTCDSHRRYYDLHLHNRIHMQGPDRLVILSLEKSWRHECPDANFYLHDGFGRALPYAMLLAEGKKQFSPVEVFLAQR